MKTQCQSTVKKIDVQSNCEFDKWYTTTVKLSNQTSQIDFAFGKWSSIAISKIEITDTSEYVEYI